MAKKICDHKEMYTEYRRTIEQSYSQQRNDRWIVLTELQTTTEWSTFSPLCIASIRSVHHEGKCCSHNMYLLMLFFDILIFIVLFLIFTSSLSHLSKLHCSLLSSPVFGIFPIELLSTLFWFKTSSCLLFSSFQCSNSLSLFFSRLLSLSRLWL